MMLSALRAARAALSGACAPYQIGGCGFCNGSSSIGTSSKRKMLAAKIECLAGEPLHDQLDGFVVDVPALGRIGAEIGKLDRRSAAAETELQPAAAHLIEHADFLNQPQRMIERHREHHRAEAQPPGALRQRGKKHVRRWRHAERRRMVLGEVIGVEAGSIVGLGDLQAVFIKIRQRWAGAVEVIENSKFHFEVPAVAPM